MTKFTFENGDIINGNINVGWLSNHINHRFECIAAVKAVLESHGHELDVKSFRRGVEVVCTDPYIRILGYGIYISRREDDMNYAQFTNELNCAKSCANAVLKVMVA